jgi:hypothetical protein
MKKRNQISLRYLDPRGPGGSPMDRGHLRLFFSGDNGQAADQGEAPVMGPEMGEASVLRQSGRSSLDGKGEAMGRKDKQIQGQILALNGKAEVMVSFLRFDTERHLLAALGSIQEFIRNGCERKFIVEKSTGVYTVERIPLFADVDLNVL